MKRAKTSVGVLATGNRPASKNINGLRSDREPP